MATIPDKSFPKIASLYQAGQGAREISKQLGYSIDAVYYAMRKHKLPRRDKKASSAASFANKAPSFKIPDSLSPNQRHLKLIGTTLYWAEGYKTEKSAGIDFANSDKAMVLLFLRFLREVCHVNEKRLRILLYSHSLKETPRQIHYWSTILNIPKSQFSKPYIAKTQKTLEKKSKMPYGLVHLRYADKKLLSQILDWIEDLK